MSSLVTHSVTQILFAVMLTGLFAASVAGALFAHSKRSSGLACGLTVLALAAGIGSAMIALAGGAAQFDPPGFAFSLRLGVDRLSAFFLFVISFVGGTVALFSGAYFGPHYSTRQLRWIWALLPAFVLSMVIVVTARTGFAFLFGWELMTLTSAALIMVEGDSPVRRHSVMLYLLMMHIGAAAVAAAFFVFLPFSQELTFAAMRSGALAMSPTMRTVVLVLALVGFGTKAGIIPVHVWLPRAHPIAPTPVSALMSGVMLKTAVYGVVRFAFDIMPPGAATLGYVVLAAGAVSGILGILYALAEHDLKRLLAYSSVENIGVIFMAIGAALVFSANHSPTWAAVALAAALMHSFNHAIFKSLLFVGAGAIGSQTHTMDINEMGGLSKRMPFTASMYLVACCSIAGLPLFSGFVGEWVAIRSFIGGGSLESTTAQMVLPVSVGALALIGALAAACFVKVYGIAFLGRPRSEAAVHATEVHPAMQVAMALLAIACVVVGIFPRLLIWTVEAAMGDIMPAANIAGQLDFLRALPMVALAILVVLLPVVLWRRMRRTTATWGCGLPALSPRMQYSATSFSKPLRTVFFAVYNPDRRTEFTPGDQPYFPAAVSYRSVRTTSYERALYRPAVDLVVNLAHRVRRLHTGNIQSYLMYIFAAIVLLLAFLRLMP